MQPTRILIPFAVGVAVGVAAHKYWPQIQEVLAPNAKKGLARGSEFIDRARTQLWEQKEKFADLVAEIREEDEIAPERAV